jgi:eukaryotic-like serine/threonine-protein kinase
MTSGPETLGEESGDAPGASNEETREISLETIAALDAAVEAEASPAFEIGTTLGRYVLLKELGRGGMAVVYVAYDPELDRRVALKLVRPRRDAKRASDQERLLREAQALARLSHPNVVHVYDVGIYDAHVYIAMELVAGQTFRAWLSETRRSWREVLDICMRAGHGLAAAHAAGLVHLDFKPSNVVLGEDGRVRVVDFGLARESRGGESGESGILQRIPEIASASSTNLETITGAHRLLGEQLTECGTVIGTPGYIAPEQLRGESPDERADQFSFCVALWEGLFGQRPFVADDRRSIEQAVLAGRITPPPTDRRVPPWLRRIVERGLSVQAEDRFPGMTELLAALDRDPARNRRRIAGWASVVAVVGASGVGWYHAVARDAVRCTSGDDKIAEVWTQERREGARAAFEAIELPFAEDAWRGAEEALDRHVADWKDAYVDACEATHLRGEQSAELLDLRMHCLERARTQLDALIDVFEAADDAIVRNATDAVAKLGSIAECSDVIALRAEGRPIDPELRAIVDALDLELSRASGLSSAGLAQQALDAALPVLERAEALDVAMLESVAASTVSAALAELGRHDDAVRMLDRAVFAAERAGVDRLRAQFLTKLAYLDGYVGANYERAWWLLELAREILERIDEEGTVLAEHLSMSGVIEAARGRHDQALALLLRARDKHREIGEINSNVATTLLNLGGVHFEKGEYERSLGYYQEAHELTAGLHGEKHPEVCLTLENLGNVLHTMGRSKEALEHHRQAIEICEAAGMGSGFSHAIRLNNEATVLTALSRHDEAVTRYERVLVLSADNPRHPLRGVVLSNLAESYVGLGKPAEALELFEQGMAILADATGPETIYYAAAQAGSGHALVELGRNVEAVERLEAALRVMQQVTADDQMLAEAGFDLARALVATSDDPETVERARSLAERAHAISGGAGERGERLHEDSRAWLRAHGSR